MLVESDKWMELIGNIVFLELVFEFVDYKYFSYHLWLQHLNSKYSMKRKQEIINTYLYPLVVKYEMIVVLMDYRFFLNILQLINQ